MAALLRKHYPNLRVLQNSSGMQQSLICPCTSRYRSMGQLVASAPDYYRYTQSMSVSARHGTIAQCSDDGRVADPVYMQVLSGTHRMSKIPCG